MDEKKKKTQLIPMNIIVKFNFRTQGQREKHKRFQSGREKQLT